MTEDIESKIKRSVDEKYMQIKSEKKITLKIFNLNQEEYDWFIKFVKENTPNNKGYEAITILLNNFYDSKKNKGDDKNE